MTLVASAAQVADLCLDWKCLQYISSLFCLEPRAEKSSQNQKTQKKNLNCLNTTKKSQTASLLAALGALQQY